VSFTVWVTGAVSRSVVSYEEAGVASCHVTVSRSLSSPSFTPSAMGP